MDLRVRFNQQLIASVVVGEVVTLMWFYEPLRVRRLFTYTWVLTSVIATAFIGLLLQQVTRQMRPMTSWKQAFSTAMWLGMFFSLLEASQISGLFATHSVMRAVVHGLHKFSIVFAMLVINVNVPIDDSYDEEGSEEEGSEEEVSSTADDEELDEEESEATTTNT